MRWDHTTIRNVAAFWLFGLCNNYGYVIMLSAAEDIMDEIQDKPVNHSITHCQSDVSTWKCKAKSTGAVLIADNLPGLICKLTFPFFMHRIPFGLRHGLVCALQFSSYFIVAYSSSVAMSLAGVAIGSLGSGIGEITFLGLSSFFPMNTVAAWSSGTGGAGLVGSFSYAFLTEPTMAGLSPKVALLVQLFIPVVFFLTYWVLLEAPEEVYSPGLDPCTWIVPADYYTKPYTNSQVFTKTENEIVEDTRWDSTSVDEQPVEEDSNQKTISKRVPQRKLTFLERITLIIPLLHLMIPVALVYVGEYLINQGLTQLIVFDCHEGFGLSVNSQYRWYQVLYQLGVFLSRSSIKLFTLPVWSLYLLPVLQIMNMVFFLFEAIYWFVPSIGIIFAIIIFEGLLGGSSYVNTFGRIHKTVSPDVREYSLSIATVGDTIGVTSAGFIAIPLHNWVCNLQSGRH